MPQRKRKLRSAEEILGIPPQPLRPAEEILGITAPAPPPTPQPPVQQPEGMFSSFQTGVAGPLLRNVVETAADLYNAPGETLERAGRAGLEFISAFDPAGNAYEPTVKGQAARVAELNRRADERLPEPIKSMKAGMAIEEAKPRTRAGRVAGAVGSVLGEVAFPTAPETAVANIITAPFAGAAVQSAGKFVAPILRRIRGARGASVAVEDAASSALRPAEEILGVAPETAPTVQRAMQQFEQEVRRIKSLPPKQQAAEMEAAIQNIGREASGVRPVSPETRAGYPPLMEFPENPNAIQQAGRLPGDTGPPPLEADLGPEQFGVKVAPEPAYTETLGPSLSESAAFEVKAGKSPELVTKAERTPILETISALRKAGLMRATTHMKNVGGTGLFQLSEEATRIPGAIADMIVAPFTKRRTFSGPSLGSMGRSFYEAATRGRREAMEIIRKGGTEADLQRMGLSQEINSGSKVVDSYVNYTFRFLNAEDRLARVYAFRRSLEARAREAALTEIRRGDIPKSQLGERWRELMKKPPEDIAAGATLDSEIATFTNRNRGAVAFNRFEQALPKGAQYGIDLIVPFKNTPANVLSRLLEYSGITSGPKAAYLAVKGILKRSMSEAEQRAFAQSFGRASVGSGLIALGYVGYRDGWLTGMQDDQPSKRARDTATGRAPGAILVNGAWHQITGLSPLGNLLTIGATLARETEQEQNKDKVSKAQAAAVAAPKVIGQTILEQPMLAGTKQFIEGLEQPGTMGAKALGGIAGSFVPGHVSDVGQLADYGTQREAKTLGARVMERIPGVRQTLPVRQDVLGQPTQAANPLNPLRSTEARQTSNPLSAELVRLDIGISGFGKKSGQTDEDLRAKTENFGRLYIPYGIQLVSSPQYQGATDAIRQEAIKRLNERAKELVEKGKQQYAKGPLSPAALIGAATASAKREAAKRNPASK